MSYSFLSSLILPAICLVSLIPLFFALIVNKSNAHYFLGNYNALSDKEKHNFDMDGFVYFFRKIYAVVGVLFFIGGTALYFTLGYKFSFLWIAVLTIFSHMVLIIASQKFAHTSDLKMSAGLETESKISKFILVLSALFIVFGTIVLFYVGAF
ncbi:MAG: hypothetical protein GX362_04160 [Methanosarcinaceae archaeon]|nr:hypothetical protein [Methanosarcinaceae archaeon]